MSYDRRGTMNFGLEEDRKRNRPSIPWGKIFGIVIGLVFAFVIFWVWRPAWHWLFFAFIYKYWFILLVYGILIGFMIFWGIKCANGDVNTGLAVFIWILVSCIFIFWIVLSCMGPAIAKTKIIRSLEYQEINQAPETTKIRYLPLEVAGRLASSRQEDPFFVVGDVEPLEIGENFLWIAPKIPNGTINSFKSQMNGFMIIDDSEKVTPTEQEFRFGEYMRTADGIFWRFDLKHYFADYSNPNNDPPYYLWSEGSGKDSKFLGICPYITYYFDFPFMIPQWGGVMVFHDDGNIEDLTPKEAINDPRFKDQRLFPEEMAKIYAEAWAYKNGLTNAWWRHKEQTEIPHLEHSVNQMPYYLPTEEGPMWMTAAEPYGKSNNAVYKMFWVDAHNGQLKVQNIPEGINLTGPEVGAIFVKSSLQLYWYEEGSDSTSGTYILVEPRPIIRQGELWWMYTVTTKQSIGVSMTVLLRAADNQVIIVDSKEELNEWLAGKEISPQIEEGTKTPEEELKFEEFDLTKLSKEQLLELAGKIIEELKNK